MIYRIHRENIKKRNGALGEDMNTLEKNLSLPFLII